MLISTFTRPTSPAGRLRSFSETSRIRIAIRSLSGRTVRSRRKSGSMPCRCWDRSFEHFSLPCGALEGWGGSASLPVHYRISSYRPLVCGIDANRQADSELGALILRGDYVDRTVVSFDDLRADVKAQAKTFPLVGSRPAPKRLEDLVDAVRRDRIAIVPYL